MNLLPLVTLFLLLSGCNDNRTTSKIVESFPVVEEHSAVGEDPLLSQAWFIHNIGQTSFAAQVGKSGEDLRIPAAWDQGFLGQGIRVAISDSGVDIEHPDLSGNELRGEHRSYASDESSTWEGASPYPQDGEAHGTAVTGLIAAIGSNAIGSRGVAPMAQFAAFYFLGDFHSSTTSYEAKVLDQLSGPFDIFNYSYGYAGCNFVPVEPEIISAYRRGVTELRAGKGAIYVKAAGNEYLGYNSDCYAGDGSYFLGNTNTSEEHNHPYVILAAASNAQGVISSYSSPGSGVWVTAAGGEDGVTNPAMVTTDIRGCDKGYGKMGARGLFNQGQAPNTNCNYTSLMNGTSSAAPTLSGVVALMLSANPELSWRDVKHILAVTSEKIQYSTASLKHPRGTGFELAGHAYDYRWVRNSAGVDFSNTYGFGRVNARAAVELARTFPGVSPLRESAWISSGGLSQLIPDHSVGGVISSLALRENYITEAVQVKLTTDHPFIGDLGVELRSPSGTVSKLLLINSNLKDSGLEDFTLLTNAFYGERSAGTWTLKVLDGAMGNTGRLTNWKLRVFGR